MGIGGFKIYGSWFLMGVWSQGWLPVAAVISYYVQTVLLVSPLAFGSSPIISPASIDNFYSQVSSTIYTGSTLMSATPIITLSLLTGSVYTMTSLAGRATGTGRDYMDTSHNDGNATNLTKRTLHARRSRRRDCHSRTQTRYGGQRCDVCDESWRTCASCRRFQHRR